MIRTSARSGGRRTALAGVTAVLVMAACAVQGEARAGEPDTGVNLSSTSDDACAPTVTTVGGGPDGQPASEELRYSCGVDPGAPAGVVVYLHGDGAGELDDPTDALDDMGQIANDRDMLLLAPEAPDRGDGATWWENPAENTAWLRSLVAAEVPPGVPVWWVGWSGGAELISYGLLADAPDLVTGGALMMAGGGADTTTAQAVTARDEPLPDAALSVPLRWAVGSLDDGADSDDGFDALTAAHNGAAFWWDVGYSNIALQVIDDDGHEDLLQPGLLADLLGRRPGE